MATNEHEPSREELEARLEEAESLIEALRKHEVDAILGGKDIALVRLREMEEELQRRQHKIEHRNQQLEQAHHSLESRSRELEQANDELEAFTYSVSHDLRAPLRALNGFSEILEEDYAGSLDDEGREYLKRISGNALRMNELIDAMLRLTKISRHEMRLENIDLSAMAAEVIDELRGSEPEREVEVRIEPGLVARADPELIKIVLTNLLGNAWKYTAGTSGPQIEFGRGPAQPGYETFIVRDNGAGFDMEHTHGLFTPFRRLHSKEEFAGTGIGLATVARVIRRHGGRVGAEGEVGKGSAFRFTLPAT
ncbi:sensor histidine kinase [Thiohalomonas denitrificans]|uniref:histidine kinase n=1 Tax=Thiohalomonas denitrificans TaxID=415747 RepID=A0A1G5QMB9_9GAMM|nr:ATP-binding protein [Thiohalomonas denitrificans]SCZ62887.1 His Kinase A (phospho-acceptor) domain-containing protein [Thiohalomonas denitrificans]